MEGDLSGRMADVLDEEMTLSDRGLALITDGHPLAVSFTDSVRFYGTGPYILIRDSAPILLVTSTAPGVVAGLCGEQHWDNETCMTDPERPLQDMLTLVGRYDLLPKGNGVHDVRELTAVEPNFEMFVPKRFGGWRQVLHALAWDYPHSVVWKPVSSRQGLR